MKLNWMVFVCARPKPTDREGGNLSWGYLVCPETGNCYQIVLKMSFLQKNFTHSCLNTGMMQVRVLHDEKRLHALVDRDLNGLFNGNELESVVEVILSCTMSNPVLRQKMSEVVKALEAARPADPNHRSNWALRTQMIHCLRSNWFLTRTVLNEREKKASDRRVAYSLKEKIFAVL